MKIQRLFAPAQLLDHPNSIGFLTSKGSHYGRHYPQILLLRADTVCTELLGGLRRCVGNRGSAEDRARWIQNRSHITIATAPERARRADGAPGSGKCGGLRRRIGS